MAIGLTTRKLQIVTSQSLYNVKIQEKDN